MQARLARHVGFSAAEAELPRSSAQRAIVDPRNKESRAIVCRSRRWPTRCWSSITNLKAHSRRWRIASQTTSRTLTRAYRLQFDSTIVHGAYGMVVRCNISSTASRY